MRTVAISEYRRVYHQVLFFSAAFANASVALCYFLAFERFSKWLGVDSIPETPLLPMYAKLFALAVLMFGVAYFLAGCWPTSESSFCLIAFGTAGKLAVFGIMLSYVVTANVPWRHAGLTFFDFLYSILFAEYLIWFRRSRT